jgi:phosphatidylserine/phosphatidylglycerophosphate/cardiolipin synthase-like enzyme
VAEVFVHSKLVLVDDTFVRIGSSNLNNRSMGRDTECDIAIEDGGATRTRAAIRGLLARLVGEHVGASPEQVLASLQQANGSLGAAIASLNTGARRLGAFPAVSEGPVRPVIGTSLFDPSGPREAVDWRH